jgi:DNA repair exonuclease SbcCD ATPase subunit
MSDTQKLVDDIVGMDFNTFTQSVFITDKTQSFCTLTDAKQKELLEDILQIGVLSEARKVAKNRIISVEKEIADIEGEARQYRTLIQNAVINKKSLTDKSENWLVSQNTKIDKLKLEIKQKTEYIKKNEHLNEMLVKSTKQLENNSSGSEELYNEIKELEKEVYKIKARTEQHRNEIRLKSKEIEVTSKAIRKDCESVSRLAGTVCTNCKQSVDTDVAQAQLEGWNVQLLALSEKYDKLQELLEQLNEAEVVDLEEVTNDLTQKNKEYSDKKSENSRLASQIQVLQRDLSVMNNVANEIERLNSSIETIKSEENPYIQLITEVDASVEGCEDKIAALSAVVEEKQKKLKYLHFWDHGFSNAGIKSYMMDNVIPFLNERAQRYADIMSGGSLRIKFNTQTTNKGGDTKDKFSVDVINARGGELYKGNSSGERRRADLAISWALADLAGSRALKPMQLLALDEPFENLDAEGVESAFRLLNSAVSERGSILVITHNQELKDMFAKYWTVEKRNGASWIKEN